MGSIEWAAAAEEAGADEYMTDPEPAGGGAVSAAADKRSEDVPVTDDGFDYNTVAESTAKAAKDSEAAEHRKQLIFTCACVVAGFLLIVSIIFGTAAACMRIASPVEPAYATAAYIHREPQTLNAYYDAGGKMHVNVYITRAEDRDINIYVDADGNATTELGELPEKPDDPGLASGDIPEEPVEPAPPETPEEPEDPEEPVHTPGIGMTEEEILAAMEERIAAGGSGYSESDVKYTVEEGDMLYLISHMTGFSVDFLAKYNHIADKNLIITGEVLRYPSFN